MWLGANNYSDQNDLDGHMRSTCNPPANACYAAPGP
jgi:hypothetical protein